MISIVSLEEVEAIAAALGLGEPAGDVLRELRQRPELQSDTAACLEHAALALGVRVQRLSLRPKDTLPQLQRFRLAHCPPDGQWIVLSPGSTTQMACYQSGRLRRIRPRALKRLIGPKPAEWLAFELPEPAAVQKHLSPLARLRLLLRPEHGDLGLILAYSLGMGVLGLAVPISIQALVNTVAFGTQFQPLLVLTLVVLLVLGVLALLRSFRLILVEMLQRRVFVRVTQVVAEGLVRVLPSELEQRRLPEVVNRFFDVMTVQKSAAFLLLDGLGLLLQTITGMTLLAFYHPVFLAFDAGLLGMILIILFGLGYGAQRSSIAESGQKYAMAAWLEELAAHPMLFKSAAGMHQAVTRTEGLMQGYLKARQRHFRVVLRQNVAAFMLQAIGSAALLGIGGWLVIAGELSLGQLVAAELIVAGVLDSFAKLGKHLEVWYDLMAALDKLGYLYDLPRETSRFTLLNQQRGPASVRIDQLGYRHPQHLRSLSGLNLDCPPGCRVALYDQHSWEAPVLLDLIYGLRRPDNGMLLIDGQPLQHLMLPDYRTQVALVRDVEIVPGTLLEHLRLGRRELSRSEAQGLLEGVGLWERVCKLPEGLDTRLGFNGLPLALEDVRRLMIARALAMRPRLLLIDGTLDQLDWRSEGPLSATLLSQREMTLIVRTGLPELISRFDQIYAIEPGGLRELSPDGLQQINALRLAQRYGQPASDQALAEEDLHG